MPGGVLAGVVAFSMVAPGCWCSGNDDRGDARGSTTFTPTTSTVPTCPSSKPMPPAETPTWTLGLAGDEARIGGVAVTPAGDVVVFGSFSGSLDAGGTTLVSHGSEDLFLLDLDATGHLRWSKSFADPAGSTRAGPIAVDTNGNIVLSAAFTYDLELGPGLLDGGAGEGPDGGTSDGGMGDGGVTDGGASDGGVAGELEGGGSGALALAAVDPQGTLLWIQAHGVNVKPDSLALDAAGNIFVTAETGFPGTVAKFDPTGNHLWSQHLSGRYGFLALDPAGNVVVAEGTGTGPVLIRKLDPTGGSLWEETFTPPAPPDGFFVAGVTVSPSGTIAVSGSLTGTLDFGGGPLTAVDEGDAAVLVLDSGGKPLAGQVLANVGHSAGGVPLDGTEAASIAFAPGGGMLATTLSSSAEIGGGTIALPATVGLIALHADATLAREITSTGWLVDADSFGTAAPTAALAVDAQGGAVLVWGPHHDPCAPLIDLGTGVSQSPGTTSVVVARFAP